VPEGEGAVSVRLTFIAVGAAWPRWTLAGTVVLAAILPACTRAGQGGSDAPAGPSRPAAAPAERLTGPRSYLFVKPVTGGTPRPLLSAAQAARLVSVSDPVWSPDGREIAFTAGCPACTPRLYLVSASGRDLREVPTGPGWVRSPGWSPHGNAIVFARQFGEEQFIVAVDLKTHRVRVINNEPASTDNSDWTPSWSPDGRRIVFARELHHEDVTLWLVPAAGGRPQPLISHEHAFDQSHPQWSPDGRDVVFMQAVSPSVTWDLYVLSTATGKLRRLTHDARNEYDPAWAPNGTRVVFASDVASRAGFRSLYVIDVTGAGLRRLTASQADDSMPSWSPDGREIVFVRRPTSRA
jgi:Tol biopolymer transport system component